VTVSVSNVVSFFYYYCCAEWGHIIAFTEVFYNVSNISHMNSNVKFLTIVNFHVGKKVTSNYSCYFFFNKKKFSLESSISYLVK
jgi:hypothetical protein